MVPGRELDRIRSHTGGDLKLEERAEEIVEAYLRAGEQGDWRALDALVNRVYGKRKETVVTEPQESRLDRVFDNMSTEELEEFVRSRRHLRTVGNEAAEN